MEIRRLHLVSAIFLTLLCAATFLAQTTTGNIRGTVTDPNGAVLHKASVVVRHVDTGAERRLTTNDEGIYLADNLQPGEYEIQVEMQGFQKYLRRTVLQTGSSVEVNIPLTIGASTETVVVTSDVAQVNTSDYKVDGVITRERIENLPLNGRSFLSLASLEPGVDVAFEPNPGAGGPNNYFRVSIAGST
ncbi:MAG TPA: carboxypeptidase-like regulatory domain-containing protein, partial [Blastocatellia bacterium]|nr:carboxypeptidase-like regulatory domain-containing protein [Blastocatellia bacterium]